MARWSRRGARGRGGLTDYYSRSLGIPAERACIPSAPSPSSGPVLPPGRGGHWTEPGWCSAARARGRSLGLGRGGRLWHRGSANRLAGKGRMHAWLTIWALPGRQRAGWVAGRIKFVRLTNLPLRRAGRAGAVGVHMLTASACWSRSRTSRRCCGAAMPGASQPPAPSGARLAASGKLASIHAAAAWLCLPTITDLTPKLQL